MVYRDSGVGELRHVNYRRCSSFEAPSAGLCMYGSTKSVEMAAMADLTLLTAIVEGYSMLARTMQTKTKCSRVLFFA
jgi:hypothetical protein